MQEQTLQKAEDIHYKFQLGIYLSGIKEIPRALLVWNDRIKDFYWNYASKINISEEESENLIKQITYYISDAHKILGLRSLNLKYIILSKFLILIK